MASKRKLKRKNKKLQHKLWEAQRQLEYAERDAMLWQAVVMELEADMESIKAASSIKAWLNGEPIAVHVNKGLNDGTK